MHDGCVIVKMTVVAVMNTEVYGGFANRKP